MIRGGSQAWIQWPVEDVYRFVVTDFFTNYPRWSPQVESLEATSPLPLREGTTGRQVRVDHGRRTTSEFVVTRLEPRRRVVFEGTDGRWRIEYRLEPGAAGWTWLAFEFELLQLPAAARPFRALVRRVVERTAAPVADEIRQLLEAPPDGRPHARGGDP